MEKLKKQLSIILSVALLLSFCAGELQVNAESTNPGMTVSDVTATTADCDWAGLISEYRAKGYVVTGFKVSISTPGSVENQVMAENTTGTHIHLYNLQPDTYYQIVVEPYYNLESGDTYQGYEWADFTTSASYVPSTPSSADPNIGTQTQQTQAPVTQTTVSAPQKPKITKVAMSDTTVGISANTVTAEGYEYRICNKKTGKVVRSETSSYTGTTFYSVPANKTYYAQVRSYVYDSNGNKVYSNWSGKKYFIAQPTISESKSKVHSTSIYLKWNKIQGATSYTVYAKKSSSNKWNKVKTTTKTSYTLTKCAGKAVNVIDSDYHVRIVANTKIKGKKYKSGNSKYLRAYTYTY